MEKILISGNGRWVVHRWREQNEGGENGKGKEMINEKQIIQKQDTRHLTIQKCYENGRFQAETSNPLDF